MTTQPEPTEATVVEALTRLVWRDGFIPWDEARATTAALLSPEHAPTVIAALVEAGRLTEEWALRYERDGDPTMDNPSGVTTQQTVMPESNARQAVTNRIPVGRHSSIRNRRVSHRYVTPWEDA